MGLMAFESAFSFQEVFGSIRFELMKIGHLKIVKMHDLLDP